jgi:hypothetical protein
VSAYAQTVDAKVAASSDGSYSFSKATVTIYHYHTKAEVFSRTFNDTVSLKGLDTIPFPPQPVFLSAFIQNGILTACKLWNNHKEYSVQNNGRLLVPAIPSGGNSDEADMFSQPYSLSPLYKLNIAGNTATFTFTESFGNSSYSFPLEGKFVIILTKDENLK